MDLTPIEKHCHSLGITLDHEQKTKLIEYLEALYHENSHTNLTRVPQEESVVRHLVDSALCLDLIPHGSRCLDLGTGPGLPGFVIACCRPDVTVIAMDSTAKMMKPLEMVPLPNLSIRVHRAELPDEREQFDFVTGRAFAPLAIQLESSAAWCRVGGTVVPYRTALELGIAKSLDVHALGLRLIDYKERKLPETDAVRLFPIYLKHTKTLQHYPRDWAKIKKRPWGS